MRRAFYIGTQIPSGLDSIEDIALILNNEVWEIEVKRTWSDFIADFKKKKYRYKKIQSDFTHKDILKELSIFWSCNYFCFAVSPEIEKRVLNYLNENYPFFGLIRPQFLKPYGKIIKRPTKIEQPPNRIANVMKLHILKRMGSAMIKSMENR